MVVKNFPIGTLKEKSICYSILSNTKEVLRMLIGDKIRFLRKNKKVTQAQLADDLSVSSQSVSKWENNLTVPDISVLPVIARYFGITMDELFNYRLDALNYKERFIRFMVNNGMLRFGEFILKSERKSPYLIHGGYNLQSLVNFTPNVYMNTT